MGRCPAKHLSQYIYPLFPFLSNLTLKFRIKRKRPHSWSLFLFFEQHLNRATDSILPLSDSGTEHKLFLQRRWFPNCSCQQIILPLFHGGPKTGRIHITFPNIRRICRHRSVSAPGRESRQGELSEQLGKPVRFPFCCIVVETLCGFFDGFSPFDA